MFYIIPDYCFSKPIYSTFKQHALESYFGIWIISHSSQDRNQPKVNYEDRTRSFLTDGNCESAMEKLLHSQGSAMERFRLHS